MATYMYTSATGSNWDDDDDEFDIDTFKATSGFSAPTIDDLGPLQRAPAVVEEEEYEVKQFAAPAPRKPAIDYDSIPSYLWPSPARATAELWTKDEYRRPAYVEMSHEGGYVYSDQRHKYNTNWLLAKVNMGCSMAAPTLMKLSPLQQSMTWEEDSEGEYIKEAGLLLSSTWSPALSQDSHSEDGQDEPFTPPGSPFKFPTVEEYDPVTAVIDIPANSKEMDDIEIAHAFADFNHISESLDVKDILGNAALNMQHPNRDQADSLVSFTPPGSPSLRDTNKEAICDTLTAASIGAEDGRIRRDPIVDLATVKAMAHNLLSIVKATQVDDKIGKTNIKTTVAVPGPESRIGDDVAHVHNKALDLIEVFNIAQATAGVTTATAEAAHVAALDAKSCLDDLVDAYDQPQDDNSGRTCTLGDSTLSIKPTGPSPDLKYIHNPPNTALVWNTVAASWFALSSVPWGRIAVAAAGALVDVVVFVARH
ncbi:hypothetical protein EKO04_007621 [Ascochyta lentis]|uniref:Uncharacterized protein n=1 Tax=Ascochyta lentis TaxID=205686 RepID=A0A8H7J1A3_9PLEO|nr:hypothetical protein EKO04_007621 [Ascochyta lentis]